MGNAIRKFFRLLEQGKERGLAIVEAAQEYGFTPSQLSAKMNQLKKQKQQAVQEEIEEATPQIGHTAEEIVLRKQQEKEWRKHLKQNPWPQLDY